VRRRAIAIVSQTTCSGAMRWLRSIASAIDRVSTTAPFSSVARRAGLSSGI
jgi:hypothetical protein